MYLLKIETSFLNPTIHRSQAHGYTQWGQSLIKVSLEILNSMPKLMIPRYLHKEVGRDG